VTAAKKYVFKSPDGAEQGPFTEDELLAKVNVGLIRPDTPVRSALLRQWKNAKEYDFLAGTLATVAPPTPPPEKTGVSKLMSFLSGESKAPPPPPRYGDVPTFVFSPTSASLRICAGLTDALLVGLAGMLLIGLGLLAVRAGGAPMLVSCLLVALLYAVALLYITIGVGFYAQTVGQWFWGMLVTGVTGEPVRLGGAFLYALGAVWAGVLTPLMVFVLPSRRGVSDLLAGARTIRTRIVNRG
jgi:uncharacterized RDD family membrane protein YckC